MDLWSYDVRFTADVPSTPYGFRSAGTRLLLKVRPTGAARGAKTRTTRPPPSLHEKPQRTLRFEVQMVLQTAVSLEFGVARSVRLKGRRVSRCAYNLRLSGAMYAQMYAQLQAGRGGL